MNWVKKAIGWLASVVATLGESIQFVAFFAHAGVASFLVDHLPVRHLYVSICITVVSAIKEYYFDARYEKNPPQTFWMNTQDFAGWLLGAWIWPLLS